MLEMKINTIEELIYQINLRGNQYVYRGQANSAWLLQSSLERILGKNWKKETANQFEFFCLENFKSKFYLYNKGNPEPTSKLAWLAAMQHHGVPTRLMDFSESPYIALYFALETFNYSENHDFSLYILNYIEINQRTIDLIKSKDNLFNETYRSIYPKRDRIFEETIDRFSFDILWVTDPEVMNERLDRQAGTFLVSGVQDKRVEELLSSELYQKIDNVKLVINSSIAKQVATLLKRANINSKNIYGDLDGLAKSIKMDAQAYASE